MKRARIWSVALLCVCSMLMTGCWDRIEIEERGTILALAIDPVQTLPHENITGSHAKADTIGYKLTVQLAIPGRIPLGPGGATGGGAAQKPVWLVSATGRTVDDAINTLQMELAEKVFLGHLRIIIINQSLARDPGLHDIMDFLRRNAEIRRLAWILISDGDALRAMEASPKLERVPTLYLVSTMDHAVELGKLPNIFLGNFWTVLSSTGQEPILPYISIRGQDQVKLEGLAVFRGDKMVDTLSPLEVAAFMELRNEPRAGYGLALPMPGDPSHSVIIKGTERKTKIKLRMENGQPVFDVYFMAEADVEERTGHEPVDVVFPTLMNEATQTLLHGQRGLLQKTQALHTDIFGFGEYVRGRQPAYWAKIKTRQKWDESYSRLPVRLHCRIYLRRSGMTSH